VNADQHAEDTARSDSVTETDARTELERILADSEFRCTERNRKFLRFAAEEYFGGRAQSIKAYTVAVDVFGRAPSFDPATDPIVRIEATRLRAALLRYYELHGHNQPIRIDLPKGHYVPVFSRVSPDIEDSGPSKQETSSDSSTRPATGASRLNPPVRTRWFSIAAGLVGGALLGVLLFAPSQPGRGNDAIVSDKPQVTIEMRLSGGLADDDALAVRDALMVALSGFRTLRISAPDAITAATGVGVTGRTQATSQRRYRVLLKYTADGGGSVLWWQVIDEASGEAMRSGTERLDAWKAEQPTQDVAALLAVRLAASRGVINTLETARELDSPTLGNGCILRAIAAIESKQKEALGQARDCLQRTLAIRRNDADAHATLAAVLLRLDPTDAPTELTDLAVASASRAVELAPDSERSFHAKMITQFRLGHIEAAIMAGRRALELNPYSPATRSRLAQILFVTGNWDEGAKLARDVHARGPSLGGDADITLAFDAYRRNRYEEALLIIRQMNKRDCFCVQVLEIATLGELGRLDEAAIAITELRRSRPQFEISLHADLARRQYAPRLVALIEAGLAKAGLRAA
jgi:tetratricopeptide (TPR) repeat protein